MRGMTEQEVTARELFEELAAERLSLPGVDRRKMFGRDGLSFRGKFFAFFDRGRLVLKLPPGTAAALVEAGVARVAVDLSPTMRSWIALPPASRAGGSRRWRELLAAAQAHVSTTVA